MFSIIIPSYNQGDYIAQSIESALRWLREEDEVLVIDGSSSDGTAAAVDGFDNDPRFAFYSEPDRGYSDAVCKGLRLAKNDIIGIMSADDLYEGDFWQRLRNEFADSGVGLVFGDYRIIDAEGNPVGYRSHRASTVDNIMSLRTLLPQSSTFFRRQLVNLATALDLRYDYVADIVLFNQIACKGSVVYVPECMSRVRRHGGSRTGTRNPGDQYLEALQNGAFQAGRNWNKRKAEAGGMVLRARYQATSGSRLGAVKTLLRALSLDPSVANHWLTYRTLVNVLLDRKLIDWLRR